MIKPRLTYKTFPHKFLAIYDSFFPKKKIKVKTKDLPNPCVTKGLQKVNSAYKKKL